MFQANVASEGPTETISKLSKSFSWFFLIIMEFSFFSDLSLIYLLQLIVL